MNSAVTVNGVSKVAVDGCVLRIMLFILLMVCKLISSLVL